MKNFDIFGIESDFKTLISNLNRSIRFKAKEQLKIVERDVDYEAFQISCGLEPIDLFIHGLYYTHPKENSVRPTDIYCSFIYKPITRSNFYENLMNEKVYINLKFFRSFKIDHVKKLLIENYLSDIDIVLKSAKYSTDNLTIDEKIDILFSLVYKFINENRIKIIENIDCEYNNEMVDIEKKKIENIIKNKQYMSYFYKKEKEMNRNAYLTIKRMSKVFGLFKDEIISKEFEDDTEDYVEGEYPDERGEIKLYIFEDKFNDYIKTLNENKLIDYKQFVW